MNKLLLLLVVAISITAQAQQNKNYDFVPNQVVIKVKNNFANSINKSTKGYTIDIPAINNINTKYNCTGIEKVFYNADIKKKGQENLAMIYLIKFHDIVDVPKIVEEYLKTGYVDYAEPNYIDKITGIENTEATANDTYYSSRQWWLNNTGTNSVNPGKAGCDMDVQRAWDITKGSASIIVAIIDTGIKYDATDISARIWTNPGETNNNNKDDDGNGLVDDYYGWDFAYGDKDPKDDNNHGSNVAGIVGCTTNNNNGYAGVDWYCKIMNVKTAYSNGTSDHTKLASGIYYATDMGARIINLSLGGTNSLTKRYACDYANNKNVVICTAMGNEDQEFVSYPAEYPYVIAVGATDPQDRRCTNSSWGSNWGSHIDVCAPGDAIYSLNQYGTYNTWIGGTSQASPMVAGVCALILSINPNFTTTDVYHIITTTAEDKVGRSTEDIAGFDKYHGYGRVNAYFAVNYAKTYTSQKELSNTINTWNIFPNPANNNLYLSLENNPINTYNINIYNQYGSLVKTLTSSNKTELITLNELQSGIYYLQLISNDIFETKKIIVQK